MNTYKTVLAGLLVASALALGYIESLIPVPFPVAGAKLGLANIITVFCLYELSIKETCLIVILRIILSGFLFSSISAILYALSGAVLSLLAMVILKRLQFNIILVSICGGISHNTGQLITACLVTQTWSLFGAYFPYLFVIGTLTGLFVGIASSALLKAYQHINQNSGG